MYFMLLLNTEVLLYFKVTASVNVLRVSEKTRTNKSLILFVLLMLFLSFFEYLRLCKSNFSIHIFNLATISLKSSPLMYCSLSHSRRKLINFLFYFFFFYYFLQYGSFIFIEQSDNPVSLLSLLINRLYYF